MNTRPFDDLQVSEVGLGTWQLGADWAEVSDADAQEILEGGLLSSTYGEAVSLPLPIYS